MYGRAADTTNCFSPDLVWGEDQDKGYVLDGFLRTSEETYSGYYRVMLDVASYGTTAEYGDSETLDISTDAHDLLVRVTRKTLDNHQLTVRWTDSGGGSIGSEVVSVDSGVGVAVDVLIEIPSSSDVGRYELDYGLGTGIDYFAITTPGHVDPPSIIDPGPTTGTGWTRLLNCAEL